MKQTIILLHGALGSSAQMDHLATLLDKNYNVIKPDFPGHGHRIGENGFSINGFAEDVAKMIPSPGSTYIFGYSMGGYVALKLALEYPGLIKGLVTLGTRLHWDPSIAESECKMLNPEVIKIKVPAFAAELQKRHGNWELLLERTSGLLQGLGNSNVLQSEDYPNISTPVLLMLGDRDKMVSLEETLEAYKKIPGAQMAILPGTPHPFEKVDPGLVHHLVERFISGLK